MRNSSAADGMERDARPGRYAESPSPAGSPNAGYAGMAPPGGPAAGGPAELAAAGASMSPEREPLLTQGQRAMQLGREPDAIAYAYGSAVAEEGSEVLDKYRWVEAFKRPVLAVRWGIGVQLSVSPKNYEGSYYPVGTSQNIPDRPTRGRRGGGRNQPGGGPDVPGMPGRGFDGPPGQMGGGATRPRGMMSGRTMPDEDMPRRAMAEGMPPGHPGGGEMFAAGEPYAGASGLLGQTVGELGDALIKRLRERIERGQYGPLLVDLSIAPPPPPMPRDGPYPGDHMYPMGAMAGPPGMMDRRDEWRPGGRPNTRDMEAPPGVRGAADMERPPGTMDRRDEWRPGGRPNTRDMEAPPGAMGARGMAAPPGMAGPMGPAGMEPGGAMYGTGNPDSLSHGVTMLGKGETKDLLKKAAEQRIDVLAVFEVSVDENIKTKFVTNKTRLVVWDVAKGVELAKTGTFQNIQIQKSRAEDPDGEDPVASGFDKLFAVLDSDPVKAIQVRDVPAELKREHVEGRVAALLADTQVDKLAALAEIKYFSHRGLISDGLLAKSFQQLLGDANGSKLATGSEEERLEVLAALLPRPKG